MSAVAKQKMDVSAWSLITIFGVIIYVGIDVLLAFLRPHYSLLHNAESDYGRGPYFWVMDINFLLRCFVSLALVKALLTSFPKLAYVKRSSYWLATWALTSGLLAFFADNPAGYKKLWSGSVHVILALVAFIAILVAMIYLAQKLSEMGAKKVVRGSLISFTVIAVLSFLLQIIGASHPHHPGGLYERIFLGSVLVWESILAWYLLKLNSKSVKG